MRRPPTGYSVRSATRDDLHVVAEMVRACDVSEWGKPNTTDEEIGDMWSVPGVDLASDTWLVWSGDDLSGFAWLLARADHTELDGWGVVHPEHRRRGLGTFLLDAVEERAAEHAFLAPPGKRVIHRNDVAATDRPAHELLERRGFSLDRHFWRMDVELGPEHPREPDWPEGIEVRNFLPGRDERSVHAAFEEAFADHYAHVPWSFDDWMVMNIRGEGFDPSLWFLAVEGDEIAGALAGRIIEDEGWVNTLGVRREWRHRGIGESLLRHAFVEFHRRGIRKSSLHVDALNETGATALYERVGMSVACQFDLYQKQLRAGQESEERATAEA